MTWILVANRTNARLFTTRIDDDGRVAVSRLQTIEHPEGRLKDQEINTDRPGIAFDHGYGKHGMAKGQSPAEHEDQKFAKELTDILEKGRAEHEFRRLMLVAEPGFLGLLKGSLGDQSAKRLTETIPKNLTQASDAEISELVLEHLRP